MKKLVALVLTMLLLLTCISSLAEGSVFSKFQPYTSVDLSVFEKAGYKSAFDGYAFTAEFYPPNSSINYTIKSTSSYTSDDTCTIEMDIKAVYSAGVALLVPRLIFKREGFKTYCDDRMSDVYIRNGENRYLVKLSGVSRSTDSKNYNASESCVEPLRARGLIMLADLGSNPQGVSVKMGAMHQFTLSDDNLAVIKSFYNTCKEAGVFNQDALYEYSDDYYVLTLFNEGSAGTEDAVSEEKAEPEA